jgi:hypothetical protein
MQGRARAADRARPGTDLFSQGAETFGDEPGHRLHIGAVADASTRRVKSAAQRLEKPGQEVLKRSAPALAGAAACGGVGRSHCADLNRKLGAAAIIT